MPRRVFGLILALCLTGCSGFDALNALGPSGSAIRSLDVPYGADVRQRLDVYQPRDVAPDAPVVVFFYGGDWLHGSKHDYRFVAQALTSRGFVAVLPDYRLHPQVTFPAFVEDGANAVRWTHDHIAEHGGDPKRIFLMGHSAGAQIAMLLTLDAHYLAAVGLTREDIRATAGLSGPYDFTPTGIHRGVFGMSDAHPQPPAGINAVDFVDASAPPILLVQGDKDETVNPDNATHLATRQRAAGGRVDLIRYPNRGHEGVVMSFAWPFRWLSPVLEDVTSFFNHS